MSAQRAIVSGWKQIASHLGMGVRTVQRYEREHGLPIHRVGGKSRGAVIATKDELDTWITGPPARRNHVARSWPAARTNKLGAEFLLIDSEIALTFAGLALDAKDEAKRRRTIRTARKAYDTIMRLRKSIDFSETEKDKLDTNLQRLRTELQNLDQLS
jgi:hypothetical protein